MPGPEFRDRFQLAVLWPATGVDAYGQPTFTPYSPVQVNVRWNDTQSDELDPQGNTVTVDATVKIYRSVPIGSLMMLGTVGGLSGTSGAPPDTAYVVKTFNQTPDIKNRWKAYTVGLMRRRQQADNLPVP